MMKFTIAQLKTAESALVALSKESLPAYIAVRISKFLGAAGKELNDFEQQRNALVVKWGKDNPEKGNSEVTEENMEAFKAEIEPILAKEVTFEWDKIRVSQLPPNLMLTPTQAAQLEPFLE